MTCLRARYGPAVTLAAPRLLVVTASLALVSSCGNDDNKSSEPACVAVDRACSPLYAPPTYTTVFEKILRPTCASGRGTCHTADAARGGLVLEDADDTYARLLGNAGSRARVTPNDASCSLLARRVGALDPNVRMPPGPTGLSPGEICTIIQWIAEGAKR